MFFLYQLCWNVVNNTDKPDLQEVGLCIFQFRKGPKIVHNCLNCKLRKTFVCMLYFSANPRPNSQKCVHLILIKVQYLDHFQIQIHLYYCKRINISWWIMTGINVVIDLRSFHSCLRGVTFIGRIRFDWTNVQKDCNWTIFFYFKKTLLSFTQKILCFNS